MSADNITTCPDCRKDVLREWQGIGINWVDGTGPDGGCFELVIEYRALCRECGYEFDYEANLPVPQRSRT